MRLKRAGIALKILFSCVVVAYMAFMPAFLDGKLAYGGKQTPPDEDDAFNGVITVWHIAGFRPYSGSMSAVLEEAAKRVEKRSFGVFFEVMAMDEAEFLRRTGNGERPDVYSFPSGLIDADKLAAIDEELPTVRDALTGTGVFNEKRYAVPFACSGYVLLVNSELATARGVERPETGDAEEAKPVSGEWLTAAVNATTYTYGKKQRQMHGLCGSGRIAALAGARCEVAAAELFRTKDAVMAVCELRSLFDQTKLYEAGKGFAIEAYPVSEFSDLVQYLAIDSASPGEKRSFEIELILEMLSGKTQAKLYSMGMLPAAELDEGEAEKAKSPLPEEIQKLLEKSVVPNAFLLNRYSDALDALAPRVLAGDEQARDDFLARVLELVNGREIQ